jgi:flagellin
MTTINSNISALVANNAIKQNDRAMSSAIEKLATGSRISSARDDAAGLSISARMATQISGLQMAARNVNDGISLVQTADGASKEITNMLGRMRELAVQASSDTYTATDRAALDLEYQALLTEMDRVAETTEWNGQKILAGADPTITSNLSATKSIEIQSGINASETTKININSWRPTVAVDGAMRVDGSTPNISLYADYPSVDRQTPNATLYTFNDVTISAGAGGSYQIMGGQISIINEGASSVTFSGADHASIWAGFQEGNHAPGINLPDVGGSRKVIYFGDIKVIYSRRDSGLQGTTTSAVINGNQVVFTDVAEYIVGSGYSYGDHRPTWTTGSEYLLPADSYQRLTPGDGTLYSNSDVVENQGAYGAGVLYFGGNSANYGGIPTAPTRLNLTNRTNAGVVVTQVNAAIEGAVAERAKYGAYLNRLEHSADNLSNISMNTLASLSRVADTDYALETTKLARAQIISQASTAMLAQANQSKQTVLALLH